MSSFKEQKRYIEALRRYERQLNPKELEEYKMFVKRHKDEDEFDSVSMKRLKELHDKYHKPVDVSQYDKYFKKSDN